jgi:hypothetical protein
MASRFGDIEIKKVSRFGDVPAPIDAPGVDIKDPSLATTIQTDEGPIDVRDFPVKGRAAAGISSLAQGVSLGLTDLLLKPEEREREEQRRGALKTAFPTTTMLGDIASFIAPGGRKSILKLFEKGVGKIPKIPKIVKGAAATGGGLGAIEAVEETVGEPTEDVSLTRGLKEGMITAGVGTVAGGVFEVVPAVSKALAEKIETAIIKPGRTKALKGFDTKNIFKKKLDAYTLGGTLEKTDGAIKNQMVKLNQALTKHPETRINALEVLGQVEKKVQEQAKKGINLEEAQLKLNAIEKFRANILKIAPDGNVDLVVATNLKRGYGKQGALNILPGTGADITAAGEAANDAFFAMKTAIEKAAPDANIQAINKEISELIPIERALIQRIPVRKRADVLSLSNILTLGTGAGLAAGADVDPYKAFIPLTLSILSKQPGSAKLLNILGEQLSRPTVAQTSRAGLGRLTDVFIKSEQERAEERREAAKKKQPGRLTTVTPKLERGF